MGTQGRYEGVSVITGSGTNPAGERGKCIIQAFVIKGMPTLPVIGGGERQQAQQREWSQG